MINELEKLNEIYIKCRGEKTKLYFEKKESSKSYEYFHSKELESDKKYSYYMKQRDELLHNIYINSLF